MALPFLWQSHYEILDLDLQHKGWLGTEDYPMSVQSCTLNWSLDRGTHWMGDMTIGGELDWDKELIRPVRFVRNWATGRMDAFPRCAYMMAKPSRAIDVGELAGEQLTEVTSTVRLFSREYRLSRAPLGGPLDVQRGELYTQAMGNIAWTGGLWAEITPDLRKVPEPIHFDAGTDLLTIHNAIAKRIGYWSLQATSDGSVGSAPYRRPADRLQPSTPDFDFTGMREGYGDPAEHDWFQSRVVENTDDWEIPNVIVGTSRTDGVTPVRAENYDSGPYSFVGRGEQWIAPREMREGGGAINYDAPDQQSLVDAVWNDLERRGSYAPRTFEVDALWKPFGGPATGGLVHGDVNTACQLVRWSEDMNSLQMKLTLEEVLF